MRIHSFHIPVMGTGFTIDTPLKVARYGISSVMSVDDNLMEKMREYYCPQYGEPYVAIPKRSPDSRARRITAYVDFVGRAVMRQIEAMKALPFEEGSDLTKYFELLAEDSPLAQDYRRMRSTEDPREQALRQAALRQHVLPGSIDVNILTKLDRENYENGHKLAREQSDAMAALRGFARSRLDASMVFSAGVNLHLFSYVERFDDFYADAEGRMKKKIILKVSDYRSAFTQGKIFAKKGIWVSEYRIESGLNCGGHAFATAGHLLGPVLEEFKQKRAELIAQLFEMYRKAMAEKKGVQVSGPPPFRITAQGGIGTSQEHQFLLRHYELDGTGWGTPFLLVPEVTSVDDITLSRLARASGDDVYLSTASPMGIPIYNLRTSVSEDMRRERIRAGRPGSPCLNGFMAFDTEFTAVPICTASHVYQSKKIEQLKARHLPDQEFSAAFGKIVEKACVCHDLGDGALAKHGLRYFTQAPSPAVCPGPNIVYFSRIFSLKEMVDHIYGRAQALDPAVARPHMLINELRMYIDYLRDFVATPAHFDEFKRNLLSGIEYYRTLAPSLREESQAAREAFLSELLMLQHRLEHVAPPAVPV